jgi:hypothetical protein
MVTVSDVEAVYRRYYRKTKDSADAWNQTLDELGGTYSRDMSEAEDQRRRAVADMIRKVQDKVLLEEGDPLSVAVNDAMKALIADNVVKVMKDQWREIEAEAKIEAKRSGKSLDRVLEQIEGPYLYVLFNDDGSFDGWTIDMPDYWQGHGGPVAAVSVSGGVTYEDIDREIGDTLADAVDWESQEEEEED